MLLMTIMIMTIIKNNSAFKRLRKALYSVLNKFKNTRIH